QRKDLAMTNSTEQQPSVTASNGHNQQPQAPKGTGLNSEVKESIPMKITFTPYEVGEEKKKMRGRPRKNTYKKPNRVARQEALGARLLGIKEELENAGFGAVFSKPSAIKPIAEPVPDPKTGGMIAHVEEPLCTYIQRVSIRDNFAQRRPFDHLTDPIYTRLIRDCM